MSHFTEEIDELPDALLRLVAFYRKEGRERLREFATRLQGCNRILFSGMGTSDFAALAIRRQLAEAGIACFTIDAGEWLHYGMPIPDDSREKVVLISQSGESFETTQLLTKYPLKSGIIAITNVEESTLGRSASLVLPLWAGEEATISTKTYTNTLGMLYLMAMALQGEKAIDQALAALEQAAASLLSAEEARIIAAAEFLLPGNALAFVGRGPAYVSARQCALTFMEGARCVAVSFSGGGFRHGPFESLGPDFRLIVFLPQGQTYALMKKMGLEAANLGARVVFITDSPFEVEEHIQVVHVKNMTGEAHEDLFPLIVSGAHPRLLHYLAKAKGIEAGTFRYCQKITDHE